VGIRCKKPACLLLLISGQGVGAFNRRGIGNATLRKQIVVHDITFAWLFSLTGNLFFLFAKELKKKVVSNRSQW
jgi:hypothetical protein